MKTDIGKIFNRNFISGPLFQTGRRTRKEAAINTNGEVNPKNRHCLRGVDGKYGRWDEILRDILNRKLKIVQNRKSTGRDTEEDEDDEDEQMPEETGTPTPKVYDTSERGGRYEPIRTNQEDDTLQLHSDGEISGENLKTNIRRSSRDSKKPNRYGKNHILETFGAKNRMNKKKYCICYRKAVDPNKGNTTTPQDPQIKIEKKKSKRRKCYIRVHSGS